MADRKKSWVKAAWLSGALLVVPIVGLALLFVLSDDEDRPSPTVADRAPMPRAAPPPRPEPPSPVPRQTAVPPAAVPEPVSATDELDEEEPEEDAEPSVLDPCCAALEAALEKADKGRGTLRAALRACDNGRSLTNPSAAFRATNRLLEGSGLEVPEACLFDE